MNFRPFKTIRQYKQLAQALNTIIGQLKAINAQQQEIIALNEATIKSQAATVTALETRTTEITPMPLPTVEAVEGLCAAFFDAESVIIAREALDLTRNLAPVGPQDVKATNLCLMKLWRHYAMRKVEEAAKQDVL
ncbi:MAG TPA: hypothetical protein VN950_19070 [Terriglobales bacterium]|nr:hypothetical protein [Terriglobales bacterium]